jgi:pyruvate/2-oxoglutarate dehydrogenase complex dihydrolipoamide dehydrogenase (E3) component
LKDVPYLTNETLFSLTELPKRLGVIGAGPIGCEMAQSFARFGSEVFLVEAEHGILPREDRDASEIVRTAMERDGVKFSAAAKTSNSPTDPNGVRLQSSRTAKGYDVEGGSTPRRRRAAPRTSRDSASKPSASSSTRRA